MSFVYLEFFMPLTFAIAITIIILQRQGCLQDTMAGDVGLVFSTGTLTKK